MGVKKSIVWTSARSGVSWYTPASSAVSKPTSTFGSCCRANFPSTESSAAGLSLDAQPAAFTDWVRRNGLVLGTATLYASAGVIFDKQFITTETRRHRGESSWSQIH